MNISIIILEEITNNDLKPYILNLLTEVDTNSMAKNSDQNDPKNVIRIFFIMLGICLFFFFLVLVPYFSLRFDSKSIAEIDLVFNSSSMISSLNDYINESKDLKSVYDNNFNQRNDSNARLETYKNQLDKVTVLHNNANVTVAEPVMQSILGDMHIFPKCINQTFATGEWVECNYNEKLFLENKTVLSHEPEFKKEVQELYSKINNSKNEVLLVTKSLNKFNTSSASDPFIKINDVLIFDASLKNLVVRMINSSEEIHKIMSLPSNELIDSEKLQKLKDKINVYRNTLEDRDNQLSNKIVKVSSMFENFQTPVGTIPIGFQELVALFPFIISILFLFFVYSLVELMNPDSGKPEKESFIVNLLFDPYEEKKHQKLQITLLLIPISIFAFSLIVTNLVYFAFDEPSTDIDDPFRAAVDLNKLIYVAMSILASIFMALGLWKLFFGQELRKDQITK